MQEDTSLLSRTQNRSRKSVRNSVSGFVDVRYSSAVDPNTGEAKASFSSTIINMLNTTLGTAILSYAYVFASAGYGAAIILLTFAATLDFVTSYLMAENSRKVGMPASMSKMAAQLSPYAALALDLCVVLNCVGANVGFTIVSTDNLTAAFGWPRWACVLIYHALCAPLCFLKSLDSLRFTSFVSLVLVVYIIVVVIVFFSGALQACDGTMANGTTTYTSVEGCPVEEEPAFGSPKTVLEMMPTTTLSFAAEYAVPYYYNEMESPTMGRMAHMLGVGHVIVWCMYIVIGMFGAFTFGSATPANILNGYPTSDVAANIARVGLALALVTSYPLVNLGVRDSVASIVNGWCCKKKAADETKPDPVEKTRESEIEPSSGVYLTSSESKCPLLDLNPTRMAASTADLIFTMGVGIAVSDVAIVLSFVGATGSTVMGIIAPGFLYFYLHRDPKEPTMTKMRVAALTIGCFGIILSITGIVLTVMNLNISPEGDEMLTMESPPASPPPASP